MRISKILHCDLQAEEIKQILQKEFEYEEIEELANNLGVDILFVNANGEVQKQQIKNTRIILADKGKYKYEIDKKEKPVKQVLKVISVRSLYINEQDLQRLIKNAIDFLQEFNIVGINIQSVSSSRLNVNTKQMEQNIITAFVSTIKETFGNRISSIEVPDTESIQGKQRDIFIKISIKKNNK